MIDLNYLYGSFLFYSFCKLVSYFGSMYTKSKHILASIPEQENDSDVDTADAKWVPKKKHEVLKAKYKCLKKLFQIYDASIIGILPERCGQGDGFSVEERDDGRKSRRKKRSHRTRADACAGTTDVSSDVSEPAEQAAAAVLRDLNIERSNTMTAETINTKTSATTLQSELQNSVATSKESSTNASENECQPFQQPTYYMSERRKPTRFQNFIQRLLGIRREPRRVVLNGYVLTASDNDINHRYVEKRRRRGLRPYRRRCRRLRRPKKAQSEGALRDAPLLDYAQAVQRTCLLDTTPRQCPIAGCRTMFYGIINYNDHLNMCHFIGRRFVCHFCHEGFEIEGDKLHHESEHIGLTRLAPLLSAPPPRPAVTSNTQTDPHLTAAVQEDKLKKIVSFFDKIGDSEQILAEIKQNSSRYSESNLKPGSEGRSCAWSCKRTASCAHTACARTSAESELFGVKCSFCGEKFDYRRQLSLHVDLEHRVHGKFSKFHSCVGMTGHQQRPTPGHLAITSPASTLGCPSTLSRVSSDTSNLTMSSARTSVANSIVGRLKGANLKWEAGTKIIRV